MQIDMAQAKIVKPDIQAVEVENHFDLPIKKVEDKEEKSEKK